MQDKDLDQEGERKPSSAKVRTFTSSQIVTAESVQAEEVPTVPLGSMQMLSSLQPEIAIRSTASTQSARLPAPLVVQPIEYRRSLGEWFRLWWDGIRPAYLLLAIMPVLLGSALAWTQGIGINSITGTFHLPRFLELLGAVILLQIGANLVNDYYDYIRGIDTSNALGPGGLIQQGLFRPARVLSTGLGILVLGAFLGMLAAFPGGILAVLFMILGLLAAYFYSGPTRGLSSLILGELTVFSVFGPLLTLEAYLVQIGHIDYAALLYSLGPGLLAVAAVYVNNMRDMESDLQAGKHTLANSFGMGLNRFLSVVLLLGAFVPVVEIGLPRHAPHLVLIALWTLPGIVVAITGIYRATTAAGLHGVMRQILRSATLFTILLIVALIASAFFPLLPHLPGIMLPF